MLSINRYMLPCFLHHKCIPLALLYTTKHTPLKACLSVGSAETAGCYQIAHAAACACPCLLYTTGRSTHERDSEFVVQKDCCKVYVYTPAHLEPMKDLLLTQYVYTVVHWQLNTTNNCVKQQTLHSLHTHSHSHSLTTHTLTLTLTHYTHTHTHTHTPFP